MDFETTVKVAAGPAALWRVLVDVERWPAWTPTMQSVHRVDAGELRLGSEARVKQPGLRLSTWKVTELEADRTFTWETSTGGVTTAGGHHIAPDGEASVLTLTLRQRGPLAGVVGFLLGRRIRRSIELEAAGLRAAAERG